MIAKPVRLAAAYVGGTCLIVFFSALLTFIFSFLGTIFCAVLAGMMIGAARKARWQAIPLSLIFPAVLFCLLRFSRAELPLRQLALLAVVCFASFWGTALVAFLLVSFEQKQAVAAKTAPAAAATPILAVASAPGNGNGNGNGHVGRLTLKDLEGRWICARSASDRARAEKLLVIDHEHMSVRITGERGHLDLAADAVLRLETAGTVPTLVVSKNGSAGDPDGQFCI
jgi:uncharacterized membrane protein